MTRNTWSRPLGLFLIVLAAGISFSGITGLLRVASRPRGIASSAARGIHLPKADAPPNGPVYPYSVVSGGVSSAVEVWRATLRDPPVAEHYRVLNIARLRTFTLNADLHGYVSFRVGDTIYWTQRPVRMPKGEQVLNDGQFFVRARCGNRISELPQAPVLLEEPPEITAEEVPGPPSDLWHRRRILMPPAEPRQPARSPISAELNLPPDLPFNRALRQTSEIRWRPVPAPGWRSVAAVPLVAVVPEPNSVLLLGSALAFLFLATAVRHYWHRLQKVGIILGPTARRHAARSK